MLVVLKNTQPAVEAPVAAEVAPAAAPEAAAPAATPEAAAPAEAAK